MGGTEQNDKVSWRTDSEGWPPIPHCASPRRVLDKEMNYCSTAVAQLEVPNRLVVTKGVGLGLLVLVISRHWFDWWGGAGWGPRRRAGGKGGGVFMYCKNGVMGVMAP